MGVEDPSSGLAESYVTVCIAPKIVGMRYVQKTMSFTFLHALRAYDVVRIALTK